MSPRPGRSKVPVPCGGFGQLRELRLGVDDPLAQVPGDRDQRPVLRQVHLLGLQGRLVRRLLRRDLCGHPLRGGLGGDLLGLPRGDGLLGRGQRRGPLRGRGREAVLRVLEVGAALLEAGQVGVAGAGDHAEHRGAAGHLGRCPGVEQHRPGLERAVGLVGRARQRPDGLQLADDPCLDRLDVALGVGLGQRGRVQVGLRLRRRGLRGLPGRRRLVQCGPGDGQLRLGLLQRGRRGDQDRRRVLVDAPSPEVAGAPDVPEGLGEGVGVGPAARAVGAPSNASTTARTTVVGVRQVLGTSPSPPTHSARALRPPPRRAGSRVPWCASSGRSQPVRRESTVRPTPAGPPRPALIKQLWLIDTTTTA